MRKIFYNWREKLWVTPAIYSFLAVLLSIAFFYVDLLLVQQYREFIPDILLTNVQLAQTIMGALAGALLTMTTFTFSTILVVLTMYSSQFSPRTLKNFVHDRLTWRVLGIFLGGFIYNTLSLMFMRDALYTHDVISTFIGIVIAFLCLSTFAYFIHHIATNVQVEKLIEELEADAERIIDTYSEKQQQEMEIDAQWNPDGFAETTLAENDGYIQFLYFDKLKEYAVEHDLEVEILHGIGSYVHENTPLFRVYQRQQEDIDLSRFITIGTERTTDQDLDFAIQKMVEVALRAISPGINDPNTANGIIIRIGRLLGKLSHLETGSITIRDEEKKGRVRYPFFTFPHFLYLTFHQLIHYGKEDVSVVAAIFESLTNAAQLSDAAHHEAIWETQLHVLEHLEHSPFKRLDRRYIQGKLDELAKAVDRRPVLLSDYQLDMQG
ncbi:DUF2254 domain-containing protein [Planococcus sp. CP5-4]|uniref:DUF2254 domain-containing protein n=1 Tax=unclassified Planococcus (in: firmicutes) TaxID=2662419 RepID=UPI001C244D8F|nr:MULTISPECIES: DUF2254 domain-containing protein [unclassified Planococcus (in: firmicutes)]MBU9674120.1 DUF2254 domain-containing protein [Planococcus sp. CP5-4_YE]MBV0910061.1 DUF2254 domain-containing protein [Planococcus sp. CP5-4_UN]MBW6064595.1 DUF2254 domain-containing protein [Planococcus sp. CP5-4]